MSTYYARVKVEGTNTPQPIRVQAGSSQEARKLIEAKFGGKVKTWVNLPMPRRIPPPWFK